MKHEIRLISDVTIEFKEPEKAMGYFDSEIFKAHYAVFSSEREAAGWVCKQVCAAVKYYADDENVVMQPCALELFRLRGGLDDGLPEVWESDDDGDEYGHGVIVATVAPPVYTIAYLRETGSKIVLEHGTDESSYCTKAILNQSLTSFSCVPAKNSSLNPTLEMRHQIQDEVIENSFFDTMAEVALRRGAPTMTLRLDSTPRNPPSPYYIGVDWAKKSETCTALVSIMRTGRWVMWANGDPDQSDILCDPCAASLQALWDKTGVEYNIESVPWYCGCNWCGKGKSNEILHDFRFLLEEVLHA